MRPPRLREVAHDARIGLEAGLVARRRVRVPARRADVEAGVELRGAADSSFVANDVDVLAGLGVSGGNAHAPGEWIELGSLVRQGQRMAIWMSRLAREAR